MLLPLVHNEEYPLTPVPPRVLPKRSPFFLTSYAPPSTKRNVLCSKAHQPVCHIHLFAAASKPRFQLVLKNFEVCHDNSPPFLELAHYLPKRECRFAAPFLANNDC